MNPPTHIDAEALAAAQPGERYEPTEKLGRCRTALLTVALFALLTGVVLFLALVVVPTTSAAGGCGGG